jgi:hemolysin activation/secretion protein
MAFLVKISVIGDRDNLAAMLTRAKRLLAAILLLAVLPVAAAAPSFDLLEFEVEGNTVLPALAIERAVYPWLGPAKTLADIEKARAALEAAYQDSGYLSVSVIIPEQKIAAGLVRLQVVEGSVEKLKVSGNRYHARSEIRAETPALAPGEVPHFPTVQQELAALGRTPDLRASPLLRPGKQPGKLEVELAVEDELPLHGSVELNNKQSPDTSEYRLEAGLRYDNLFQKRHGLGLNFVVAPENTNEVNVLVTSYTLPLSATRSLSLSWQHSNSNIASAADSAVVGKGDTLGMRLIQQLPAPAGAPTFFHSFALGFDAKDLKETQNALGADRKDTPLRYAPLVAQYTAGSFSNAGDLLGNFHVVAGLRGFDRKVDCQGVSLDQFECRRAGAQANFAILRGDLSYTRRVQGWEVLLRADGQASSQPLVSNEQFLAGGSDSVRGYLEGEAAGDFGWRLRAEIKTPVLLDAATTSLRGVVFIEGAALALHDPLPGQADEFKLASAGTGLRLKVGKEMYMSVDWARASRTGPRTARGEQRAHMRLGYQF